MGTKLNPSADDAWDKADDDETRVAFLARDPFTEPLLRIYAAWQAGDAALALLMCEKGNALIGTGPYKPGKGNAHAVSMTREANAVVNWRMKHQPRKNVGGRQPGIASPADIIVQCEQCGDKVLTLVHGLCISCELAMQEQLDADRDRGS